MRIWKSRESGIGLSNARAFAASTFTTLAEIKPAFKVDNLGQLFLRGDDDVYQPTAYALTVQFA